jgi:fructosamine-3-kinase
MTRGPPGDVVTQVEQALETWSGSPRRLAQSDPVGGGCVNSAARVTTDQRETWFLKWNPGSPRNIFEAEAEGLRTLAAARALRVPAVLAVGDGEAAPPWLLLEFVAEGRPSPDYTAVLAAGLAALHQTRGGRWGWERDNFIGSLPQQNPATASWGELWRDARLGPQLRRACSQGHFAGQRGALLERVIERTSELLGDVEDEGPSLLHGDLWGGNVYPDGEGQPVLIDPAVYRGHREVDLAMSELFGGFASGWPGAYENAWPVAEGYRAFRRHLYQLYYLLVHVNMFGAGYEAGCLAAARGALRAV